ncbi:MAG TPA: NADP-dependent isocitrate dehydrogenase [Gammaproteobacteria bacterium]|jgi:isocitrate dehydrogenase|nr:NADP-dependent isocitrate dehydrogenase [Gammaproteobacteria bacterium]
MTIKTPITIAYGDGIGPEIMKATLKILDAANAAIDPDVIEVGKNMYLKGYSSGIPDSAWQSLQRTKVLLKGPITTPQGSGYKSLNVTLRKTLGLYANVRPCMTFEPYIPAAQGNMDLVIIRENEEDTYSGIEYRQTADVYACTKLITRPGCERIVEYAFEYARKFNRKKVTCLSKDNIMKMTDGLFHRVFNEIAAAYPDIETDHFIVDIGTALIACQPQRFDVLVTLNLYGDIISDVAAQVAGSVGIAGSANIGNKMAMFEAIHGSAPDIAGKDIANPSGLLNAAIQMLVHINQPQTASLIENAWLKTIEDGIHTGDIYAAATSKQKVGTQAFADNVIQRLGQTPTHFKPVHYQPGAYTKISCYGESTQTTIEKKLIGIDIYIDNTQNISADTLASQLAKLSDALALKTISSRGLKIWPNSHIEDPYLGYCCLRFESTQSQQAVSADAVIALQAKINAVGFSISKTENLYLFDNALGFSLAQGE